MRDTNTFACPPLLDAYFCYSKASPSVPQPGQEIQFSQVLIISISHVPTYCSMAFTVEPILITVITPMELPSQALCDLLAHLPSGQYEALHEDLFCCSLEDDQRCITFDDSSTHQGDETGIVLYDLDDIDVSLTFKLEILCSNKKLSMNLRSKN